LAAPHGASIDIRYNFTIARAPPPRQGFSSVTLMISAKRSDGLPTGGWQFPPRASFEGLTGFLDSALFHSELGQHRHHL
jgi:hypothetical protein